MYSKPDLNGLLNRAERMYRNALLKLEGPQDPDPFMLEQIRNDFVRVRLPPIALTNRATKSLGFTWLAERAVRDRACGLVFTSSSWTKHYGSGLTDAQVFAKQREDEAKYGYSWENHPGRIEVVMFWAFAKGRQKIRTFEIHRMENGAPQLGEKRIDGDDAQEDDVVALRGDIPRIFLEAFDRCVPL